jgi:ribosomal protein L3 glutamine methyltransferase
MTAIKRILSIDDQASICQMIQFTMSDMSDDNVHYEVDVAADGASGLDKAKAQRYDLIISNPPYVNAESMAELPDEYRREPELALASGEDGLDFTRIILSKAADHLNPGGVLVVEIGHNRDALEDAFPETPFVWLDTAAGDDFVFLLRREDLPRVA